MTTLIVPACGRSSRFGDGKPKYMRTHPGSGDLMLVDAIVGITGFDRIIIGVVREHIETHRLDMQALTNKIEARCDIKPQFIIMDDFTSSQSETVYKLIGNIDGSFFVKDCDNYFETVIGDGNVVCTSKLASDTNATNKSYVSLDKMGKLSGIVEKMVIGNEFCCGGYGFESAKEFRDVYEKVSAVRSIEAGELYISHIIQDMLLNGVEFDVKGVNGYLDWGDKDVWREFCDDYKTVFCDIDGTIFEGGSEYFEPKWGNSNPILNNIETINNMYNTGKIKIILTTSRKSQFSQITEKQLNIANVKYHSIIYDLPHAQRILINDYAISNPYPTAIAINIFRNSDNLKDFME